MIKTSAAALLLSTALMTGAVVAQTAGTSGGGASGSSQFLTQQEQSQFRASKFVGLAIYGQDNQRIGDVNEILIDNTGNAKALVLGVGGFLGIGEKNVAVPFSAVEWVNERPASTAAAGGNAGSNTGAGGANTAVNTSPPGGGSTSAGMGTAGTTGGTGAAGTSAGGMSTAGTGAGTGAGARDASATGSAGGASGAAQTRSPAETAAANGAPDHGKVRMSKADLQNAPEFKYFGQAQSDQNRGSGASGGTSGTAPKQ